MSDFQPVNPFVSFQQGYGVGSAINQNIIAKQQAEAEAARKAQIDQLLSQAMGPGGTPQDYLKINQLMTPEEGKSFREAWAGMEEQEQQQTVKETAEIAAAFNSNDYDIVKDMLERSKKGYMNAGDKQSAQFAGNLLDMMELDPNTAKAMFMSSAAGIPGMDKVFEQLQKQQTSDLNILEMARKYPFASEADKNRAMVVANNLGLPSGSAEKVIELSSIISSAKDADPAEYARLMGNYEDRYNALAKNFKTQLNATDTVMALSDFSTGAAQTAILTLYNKILDPDSVVRPSEFDNAMKAQGAWENLKNTMDRIMRGELLSEQGIRDFKEAVGVMGELSKNNLKKVQDDQATLITSALGADAVPVIITDRIKEGSAPAPANNNAGEPVHVNALISQNNEADIREYLKSLGKERADLPWEELLKTYSNTLKNYGPGWRNASAAQNLTAGSESL